MTELNEAYIMRNIYLCCVSHLFFCYNHLLPDMYVAVLTIHFFAIITYHLTCIFAMLTILLFCYNHLIPVIICDVAGENRPTGASLIIEQ